MSDKPCLRCGGARDTKYPRCRPCAAAHMREYRAANPEIVRAVSRRHYQRYRERVITENRAYREANHERVLAWNRAYWYEKRDRAKAREVNARYYANNKEKVAARHGAWRLANPEMSRFYGRKRSAVERAIESFPVSVKEMRRMQERQRHCCAYCGVKAPRLEWDHVIPVSRGGRHSIGNLLLACRSCNASKNAKLLSEWRHRRFGRSEVRVA